MYKKLIIDITRAASFTVCEIQYWPSSGSYCLKFLQVSCALFPFHHEGFLSCQPMCIKKLGAQKTCSWSPSVPWFMQQSSTFESNLLTPGSHGADSESVSCLYHDGVENESWYHRHQQQSCAHQKHSREAVLVFLRLYNHQGKATRSDTPCCKDRWINVAVTRGKWDSGSPQETSTSQRE